MLRCTDELPSNKFPCSKAVGDACTDIIYASSKIRRGAVYTTRTL